MMHREEFLRKHPNIKGSMIAYSEDGEKLGKVTTLFEESLNIEKGIFFPKDYTIRYDDVVEVHDNDMIVHLRSSDLRGMKGGAATEGESGFAGGTKGGVVGPGREELGEAKTGGYVGSTGDLEAAGPGYAAWGRREDLKEGREIEIPLLEEDLQVQKVEKQRGEVHLRKFTHTEDKTMTVPVRKEEIIIERTRATGEGMAEAMPGEHVFEEDRIAIPLMEEDVEVKTSQRVRETVHVKKEIRMENRDIRGTVRVEDVELETEGETREKK
ncbi:MAG TPA: YsnF/AvaK domain-containing protein [Deltaproteobacteria bacterium]|jgi:uncharacterized protein (TIGR02271 family)|nr:YsnF/AvaK domain-containing protein [Deltaproteobacteria bacterium]HOI07502.1 YsnF/AvaK domain-containing protein [Deltaproteobacteria bacterium]